MTRPPTGRRTKPTDLSAPDAFMSGYQTIPLKNMSRVTSAQVEAARRVIAANTVDADEALAIERMLGIAA